MKRLIYFFPLCCITVLVLSCAKDNAILTGMDKFVNFRSPLQKVDVCHVTSSGEYITITISENALAAHLAHGDSEGECTDCDPNSCTFCDKLDYFDFDEPCDLSPGIWYSDAYCQGHVVQGEMVKGWAILQDYDPPVGDCPPDPEGEYDGGWIWAYYSNDPGCGDWYGLIAWAYSNDNDPNEYYDDFYDSGIYDGHDSTAYAQAVYCANVIIGINAALPTPLVNNNCDIIYDCGLSSMEITKDKLKATTINIGLEDSNMNYRDGMKKMFEDLRSNQVKK